MDELTKEKFGEYHQESRESSGSSKLKNLREIIVLIFVITIAIIFVGLYLYHTEDFEEIQVRKQSHYNKNQMRYTKKYDRLNCSQAGLEAPQSLL